MVCSIFLATGCVSLCTSVMTSAVLTLHVSREPIRDPQSLTPHLTPNPDVCVVWIPRSFPNHKSRKCAIHFSFSCKSDYFFCLAKFTIPLWNMMITKSQMFKKDEVSRQFWSEIACVGGNLCAHEVANKPRLWTWFLLYMWPSDLTAPHKSVGQFSVF